MKKVFTLVAFATLTLCGNAVAQNLTSQTTTTTTVTKAYGFDNYKLGSDNAYYDWFDKDENGEDVAFWGNANAGYSMVAAFSGSTVAPEDYPTAPATDEEKGACVKLTTVSTGTIGAAFGSPIAAGNFFSGYFALDITNTLHSTKFGQKVTKKPLSFTCWYKYAPGETYKVYDAGTKQLVADATKTDEGDIYAVLYKNTDDSGADVVLYGDDVKTNANIVATANVNTHTAITTTDGWTEFNAAFDYGENAIDETVLANGGYSLALVFTSSKDGAGFTGAEGSTMYIADLSLANEGTGLTSTYTDNLSVTINGGEPIVSKENILVTEKENGLYDLELKDFKLVAGDEAISVGDILLVDVVPTVNDEGKTFLNDKQTITLAGDMAGLQVPVELAATISDNTLNANISIPLGAMDIKVQFGGISAGVNNVSAENKANGVEAVYGINGQRINGGKAGQVVIIKYADGKTVKSIRK